MSSTLFVSTTCPHCIELLELMKSPDARGVTDDVRVVKSGEDPDLWRKHGIENVPTLVGPNGAKLVGSQAFAWLRERIANRGMGAMHASTTSRSWKQLDPSKVIALGVAVLFIARKVGYI